MQINVNSQLPELADQDGEIYIKLGGDLTPLMRGVASVIENSSRDRFRTKTAPDGSTWADLKPSTLKAKKGRGSKMVEYGDLMRSITSYANSTSAAVGTDRPYAKYHQTGTKNSDGSERMEARPIFGISTEDRTDVLDLMNDFMEELVNG